VTARPNPEQEIYADLMDEARLRIHALRDAIVAASQIATGAQNKSLAKAKEWIPVHGTQES
jgi:hypothetical protein